MYQRLKRWESPRKEGRNNKGKGGTARARQLKKQTQMMRQKLKEDNKNERRREDDFLPAVFYDLAVKSVTSLSVTSDHVLDGDVLPQPKPTTHSYIGELDPRYKYLTGNWSLVTGHC